MTKTNTLFFEDKPLFGLDIGHGSLRVMELDTRHGMPRLIGYGTSEFDPAAIKDGVIEKPEIIARSAQELFKRHLVGDITTRRVAVSVPVAKAYTRAMQVAGLSDGELAAAVETEAEQYIPAAVDDLYMDYSRTRAGESNDDLLLVAIPRRIVDSYLVLTRLLGLEAVMFSTSIQAGSQLFARDSQSDVPSLLIDFGSDSADITVYDGGLVVTGTVACGGDQITDLIAKALNITNKEASIVKTKYGLGVSKKQKQIEVALSPLLAVLIKEIRRTIRYYDERSGSERSIVQVVIMGGGGNMPGLTDYLTSNLRLAVRALDPTIHLDFGRLQPFGASNRMSYVTVAGLALTNPQEVFA